MTRTVPASRSSPSGPCSRIRGGGPPGVGGRPRGRHARDHARRRSASHQAAVYQALEPEAQPGCELGATRTSSEGVSATPRCTRSNSPLPGAQKPSQRLPGLRSRLCRAVTTSPFAAPSRRRGRSCANPAPTHAPLACACLGAREAFRVVRGCQKSGSEGVCYQMDGWPPWCPRCCVCLWVSWSFLGGTAPGRSRCLVERRAWTERFVRPARARPRGGPLRKRVPFPECHRRAFVHDQTDEGGSDHAHQAPDD